MSEQTGVQTAHALILPNQHRPAGLAASELPSGRLASYAESQLPMLMDNNRWWHLVVLLPDLMPKSKPQELASSPDAACTLTSPVAAICAASRRKFPFCNASNLKLTLGEWQMRISTLFTTLAVSLASAIPALADPCQNPGGDPKCVPEIGTDGSLAALTLVAAAAAMIWQRRRNRS
jgi:hypothetical protein